MNQNIPHDVVVRAQQGSPEDVGWLYSNYHQNIYRYLYYRTGDPYIAEDLTADVFLKMVQALPVFRIEAAPFIAWLFQIARNVVIDHYRKSAVHPLAQIDEQLAEPDEGPPGMAELHFASLELARALTRLEESQKDVLILRFIEKMPIAETALILHKTEDAVKALQRRGLNALRISLNHWEKNNE